MQRIMNEDFVVIIAKSPAELIKEGEVLHHCVGRMNYDQKFVKEQTLIFFIWNKADYDSEHIFLRTTQKGEPKYSTYNLDGVTHKAIQVGNHIYIPKRA